MSFPSENRAKYISIIDKILADSDLTAVTTKNIREGLQSRLDHDISRYKDSVKALILERFDRYEKTLENDAQEAASPSQNAIESIENKGDTKAEVSSAPLTSQEPTPSEDVDPVPNGAPTKKKVKKSNGVSDAALAARLQAEENNLARPTRVGTTRKRPNTQKKSPKKRKVKSADKLKNDDDSEIESESREKEPKRNGAFHKPLMLSPPLAELIGETTLSRPQTVKRIWQYVKANGLQNPDDKRQIRCDDAMRAVFKTDTVHMFTMNKILAQNLFDVEE